MKKLTIPVDMDDTIENLCETWGGISERDSRNYSTQG